MGKQNEVGNKEICSCKDIFAVHGDANPIVAVAIHEGNDLFVVLNSARLLWVQYCDKY
jgi:hypothetical protein